MSDASVDFFVGLESTVWDALVSGDGSADQALLADDFLGVYPTGFADRFDHAGQLDDGPSVSSYEIRSARILAFSEHIVLVAYEARFKRSPDADPQHMFVSSVWSRRADEWVNVFSQDTPAEA